MEKLKRRKFIKRSSQIGVASFLGVMTNSKSLWSTSRHDTNYVSIAKNQICRIKREVRVSCPALDMAPKTIMQYIGKGLHREETLRFQQSSDWELTSMKRESKDNGKTWEPWKTVPEFVKKSGPFTMSGGANQMGSGPFDPVSGKLVKPVFQRIFKGDPKVALSKIWKGEKLFWDHGYYQLSEDNGASWSEAFQLKFEDGPDFDPSNWGNQEWLIKNQMFLGNAIVTNKGTVVISATVPVPYRNPEDENFPSIYPNNYREGCVAGAMCFVGKWNEKEQNYKWSKSKAVFLPRRKSSRGLVELDVSELKNGHLLMIMRGSDTPVTPGRKWFSVSKDGGLTWSQVTDMRYDTGEQFYSPASISQTFRSTKTGKLYWIGNISKEPPHGDYPRYPLNIVEIDEKGPSFIKDTLTVIDSRDPKTDTDKVQFSNFSLLQDRENGEVELYLTRLGENKNMWSANAYKYTLSF